MFKILALDEGLFEAYREHFIRHRKESGRGDDHFMPFAPDDPIGPMGVSQAALWIPITEPGWQRCWVALDNDLVFGHNRVGRNLYRSLGFAEVGVIRDRFRIENDSVDDVFMALQVTGGPV